MFLDVPALLESSRPRRTVNWYWFVVGLICMLSLFDSFGSSEDAPGKSAVWLLSTLLIAGASIAAITQRVMIVRRLRAQQQTVDAIDEMMQLRRWEPAGILLDRFLSSPVRSGRLWTTALVQLASLLGRHHRFEDAIAVQDFLIENEMLDDQSDYFLRLGRAMAMLREDHLVDADRAISDLRRRGPQGRHRWIGIGGNVP